MITPNVLGFLVRDIFHVSLKGVQNQDLFTMNNANNFECCCQQKFNTTHHQHTHIFHCHYLSEAVTK